MNSCELRRPIYIFSGAPEDAGNEFRDFKLVAVPIVKCEGKREPTFVVDTRNFRPKHGTSEAGYACDVLNHANFPPQKWFRNGPFQLKEYDYAAFKRYSPTKHDNRILRGGINDKKDNFVWLTTVGYAVIKCADMIDTAPHTPISVLNQSQCTIVYNEDLMGINRLIDFFFPISCLQAHDNPVVPVMCRTCGLRRYAMSNQRC
jgi:hypothetical protein